MASAAATDEACNKQSRHTGLRENAFRVLALPAEAELRQVHRQQNRLLIAIEMDEPVGVAQYGLLPLMHIGKEDVLAAVNSVRRPDARLMEELFWLHEAESLAGAEGYAVLGSLRSASAGNTGQASIARHNLAVLLGLFGQGGGDTAAGGCWSESLGLWQGLMEDEVFWGFVRSRAEHIEYRRDPVEKKGDICRRLSAMFSEQIAGAVQSRDSATLTILVRTAMEHRSWLNLGSALKLVSQQYIRDGFVLLGAVLDGISSIDPGAGPAGIRTLLSQRETELTSLEQYGDIVLSLEELADPDRWGDAVASAWRTIAEAYLKRLQSENDAVRSLGRARMHARDPELVQSIDTDSRRLQYTILCREAEGLARRGDLQGTQQLLSEARKLATEKQKVELDALCARFSREHESAERALRQTQHNAVCRQVEALISNGDCEGARRRLKEALAVTTDEQAAELQAMLQRLPGPPAEACRVNGANSRSYVTEGNPRPPRHLTALQLGAAWIVLVLLSLWISRFLTPPHVDSSQKQASASSLPGPPQPPAAERAAIEQERSALDLLAHAISKRQATLATEEADLERRRRSLEEFAEVNGGGNVSSEGRATYEKVLMGYDRDVEQHRAQREIVRRDDIAYHQRLMLLNARIERWEELRP